MEDYSFATPMAISGTYRSQRVIVQAGGQLGKVSDIHSFAGDKNHILKLRSGKLKSSLQGDSSPTMPALSSRSSRDLEAFARRHREPLNQALGLNFKRWPSATSFLYLVR